MRKRIVINADSHETRVGLLEDKDLVEMLVERGDRRRHVGDIYKGRVNAVLPGMQAAFVEIGLPKTAFLHASDLAQSPLADYENGDDAAPSPRGRRGRRILPKIEENLQKNQEVLVQVTKESIGTKGMYSFAGDKPYTFPGAGGAVYMINSGARSSGAPEGASPLLAGFPSPARFAKCCRSA